MRKKKPRGTVTNRQIFMWTFLFFLISTFFSMLYINNGIKPILLQIAETRNKQFANMAMGVAVGEELSDDIDLADLIQFNYDQNGRVVSYQVNTALENQIQRNVQYRVENYLKLLEQGIVPDEADLDIDLNAVQLDSVRRQSNLIEIPLGQVLGLPLLANLGPKIPVNLEVIGYVNTQVETLIAGIKINNVHIEPVVHIEIGIRTIIPFGSQTALVQQSIPIGSGGYSGEVPLYYNSGSDQELPLTIPLDPLQ
ncbi:sporulation protein YunB [Amphibacillus marinus]|uniref:Sporulation protein YunB n=1 Tax=Amphibacillus marinus TaxID=872970 RepID=A0A1H8RYI6_9BACI|nr:sporulation protein YunB [Amphibacillus marinus]SEO71501.1 sporulation protein YunB [Amphibacillus marinus]